MDEEKKSNTENQPREGRIKGFFKKVGQKFDEATYDYRLKADFDKNHPSYGVYGGTAIIDLTPDITAEEHLDEDYIITLDDNDAIKKGNLIRRFATGEVFHIALVESVKLKVTFDGQGKFKSIKLTPEAINPDNPSSIDTDSVEMLEDIITTAINQASDRASTLMEQKMKSVTGGINIPGLF